MGEHPKAKAEDKAKGKCQRSTANEGNDHRKSKWTNKGNGGKQQQVKCQKLKGQWPNLLAFHIFCLPLFPSFGHADFLYPFPSSAVDLWA